MGTTTPVRGLYKPARGEVDWDAQVNANFDNLDATANTSAVTAGDAATLASAEAYTDSAVAGVTSPVTSVAGKTGAVILVEGDIQNLTSDLAAKAPLASPALTGTPTAPTLTAGDSSTSIATTAFVQTATSTKAPLASPAFTGAPTAPTPTAADNTTKIATTAFVQSAVGAITVPVTSVAGKTGAVTLVEADIANLPADLAAKAPLASPALTGTPTSPTPAAADNSTNIATTAFIATALAGITQGFPSWSTVGRNETGADANLLTLASPAAGLYLILFVASISVSSTSGIGWTVSWTDLNGNPNGPAGGINVQQLGVQGWVNSSTSTGLKVLSGIACIDTNGSAPIVVKTTGPTGTTYKASAVIIKIG